MKAVPLRIMKAYVPSLVCFEEHLDFKRGQAIFYKGHRAYGLYVVRSGKIGLYCKNNGNKGAITKVVGPGVILGEDALVGGKPYESNAVALEEVSAVFFPRSVLNLACTKHTAHAKRRISRGQGQKTADSKK